MSLAGEGARRVGVDFAISKFRLRLKIKIYPPRQASLPPHPKLKVWEGLKALNLSPVGREGNQRQMQGRPLRKNIMEG